MNEVNIFENGFVDEFKRAQRNLAINVANGRTGFANNGLPGQAALPIFEAQRSAPEAPWPRSPPTRGSPMAGSSPTCGRVKPAVWPRSMAGNQNYLCRMVGNKFSPCATRNYSAPGPYPMNFFVVNPFASGGALNLVDDDGYSNYHALQLQLRRRYTAGLTLDANYTLAKNETNIWAENADQRGN